MNIVYLDDVSQSSGFSRYQEGLIKVFDGDLDLLGVHVLRVAMRIALVSDVSFRHVILVAEDEPAGYIAYKGTVKLTDTYTHGTII